MGTGPLHRPSCRASPASRRSPATAFHTSRWDYDYTGGDPAGAPMDRLARQAGRHHRHRRHRRAVRPHLARACGELYVFQRTPSSIDVRGNRPTDPEWFAEIASPAMAAARIDNFTTTRPAAWWTRTW